MQQDVGNETASMAILKAIRIGFDSHSKSANCNQLRNVAATSVSLVDLRRAPSVQIEGETRCINFEHNRVQDYSTMASESIIKKIVWYGVSIEPTSAETRSHSLQVLFSKDPDSAVESSSASPRSRNTTLPSSVAKSRLSTRMCQKAFPSYKST